MGLKLLAAVLLAPAVVAQEGLMQFFGAAFSPEEYLNVEEATVNIEIQKGSRRRRRAAYRPPTQYPTKFPTKEPTAFPTMQPTTETPTSSPTEEPTTKTPTTKTPTNNPTTKAPTSNPTTANPTVVPTAVPTTPPVFDPTKFPTPDPTANPTKKPTANPTEKPTANPTTKTPTSNPTKKPTANPTKQPTNEPTRNPTPPPTGDPTRVPTTRQPTTNPTKWPTTRQPTRFPTVPPTARPRYWWGTGRRRRRAPLPAPTVPPPTFRPTGGPTFSPPKFATTFRMTLNQRAALDHMCGVGFNQAELCSRLANGDEEPCTSDELVEFATWIDEYQAAYDINKDGCEKCMYECFESYINIDLSGTPNDKGDVTAGGVPAVYGPDTCDGLCLALNENIKPDCHGLNGEVMQTRNFKGIVIDSNVGENCECTYFLENDFGKSCLANPFKMCRITECQDWFPEFALASDELDFGNPENL